MKTKEIICDRCANRQNCEYVPYDTECDDNFKEKLVNSESEKILDEKNI